ncbi:hypothetical protein MNBD_GAMMA01-1894 [hydrothermal vent metagenome]|uniref:Uncharacterized protein n=1 Tax=hydrothermal vent metagenome TaxID=652676 RepID=A0A3B0VAX7_9ZZZZ
MQSMKEIKPIVDPAFLRDSDYSYVNYNEKELASVLCFALSRRSEDLILHQQRIELYARNNNKNLLFSAMVDLFTILENKGTDYKKRILDKYRSLISTRQALILTRALTTSLLTTASIRDLRESILNIGLQGELLSSKHCC